MKTEAWCKDKLERGWEVWNRINGSEHVYVVLPAKSTLNDKYSLVIEYAKQRFNNVCFITDSSSLQDSDFSKFIVLCQEDLNSLISYYKFYRFSESFYVIDTRIYTDGIRKILDLFTDDEIIFLGIFKEEEIPHYE